MSDTSQTPEPVADAPELDTPVVDPAPSIDPPVVSSPDVPAPDDPAPDVDAPDPVADNDDETASKTFVLGGGNPRHGELVLDIENYDHEPNQGAFTAELLAHGLVPTGDFSVDVAQNADGYSLDVTYTVTVAPNVAPEAVTVPADPFLVDNEGNQIKAGN